MAMKRIAGNCPDNKTCPAAWTRDEDPDGVYVVGDVVRDDPEMLSKAGPTEAVVRIPRQIWENR